MMFAFVEGKHGAPLVRQACDISLQLTQEVTDQEVKDLLSMDNAIILEVNPPTEKTCQQLLLVLWLLLKHHMQILFTESCRNGFFVSH